MKVIVKHPGSKPYVQDIKYDLKSMQNIVGGYIETLHMTDDIIMICNEEGKINGLEYNFSLKNDCIMGTVFFVGDDAPEFRDLTEHEKEVILNFFS